MFQMLRNIFAPADLTELLEKGAVILDVRSSAEFKTGHIKGSKNIPLDQIGSHIQSLKKLNKPIITCCVSGNRSGSAEGILKHNGIEAYNGGSWQNVERHLKVQ